MLKKGTIKQQSTQKINTATLPHLLQEILNTSEKKIPGEVVHVNSYNFNNFNWDDTIKEMKKEQAILSSRLKKDIILAEAKKGNVVICAENSSIIGIVITWDCNRINTKEVGTLWVDKNKRKQGIIEEILRQTIPNQTQSTLFAITSNEAVVYLLSKVGFMEENNSQDWLNGTHIDLQLSYGLCDKFDTKKQKKTCINRAVEGKRMMLYKPKMG